MLTKTEAKHISAQIKRAVSAAIAKAPKRKTAKKATKRKPARKRASRK